MKNLASLLQNGIKQLGLSLGVNGLLRILQHRWQLGARRVPASALCASTTSIHGELWKPKVPVIVKPCSFSRCMLTLFYKGFLDLILQLSPRLPARSKSLQHSLNGRRSLLTVLHYSAVIDIPVIICLVFTIFEKVLRGDSRLIVLREFEQ